jgi:hypothetical protein
MQWYFQKVDNKKQLVWILSELHEQRRARRNRMALNWGKTNNLKFRLDFKESILHTKRFSISDGPKLDVWIQHPRERDILRRHQRFFKRAKWIQLLLWSLRGKIYSIPNNRRHWIHKYLQIASNRVWNSIGKGVQAKVNAFKL